MALSERNYMGVPGKTFRTRFVWTCSAVLIVANIVAFALQSLLDGGTGVMGWLSLSHRSVEQGALWTFVTYSFLHGNELHLLANMITLWCIGRFLEPAEKPVRVFALYFGGVLAGAFLWYPVGGQTQLIGASAGVCAMATYMLFRHFNDRLRFFLSDIVVRAKWMLLVLSALTLAGFVFTEIPTSMPEWYWWPALWENEVAHSAHLGGMLWGAAIFAQQRWRWFLRHPTKRHKVIPFRQMVIVRNPPPNLHVQQPKAMPPPEPSRVKPSDWRPKMNTQPATPPRTSTASSVSKLSGELLEAEVDRILDKINVSGFVSLSADERALLDRASTLFSGKK
ncbi:MAG: rhomboid family intramembrane serine protease [Puniceicoccales bacterium]|jgi:membrane associated rhomboid family serine protease|nr:rhomboid family intramembrane serine protease [Puniceicoccales bacterium]